MKGVEDGHPALLWRSRPRLPLPLPASAAVLIEIDKSTQRMTVSQDGQRLYTWPVSTGKRGHSTPSGSFKAFRMEKDHFSREWDDAPMPNSIFFTKTGHAIHGSYDVKRIGTPASHGCVRLAPENAAILFNLVKADGVLNTQVVLTGVEPAPSRTTRAAARAPQNQNPQNLNPNVARLPGEDQNFIARNAPNSLDNQAYGGQSYEQRRPLSGCAALSATRADRRPALRAGRHAIRRATSSSSRPTGSSSLITAAAIISSSRSPITARAIAIRITPIRRRPITGADTDIDRSNSQRTCHKSAPHSRRDWLAECGDAHPRHFRRTRMGILDVILGRDAQGSPSKINMALIALLLWRWYQSQSAGGAQAEPAPAPRGGGSMPRVPRQQMPEPDDEPVQIPTRKSGSGNDFDELRDSVRRVPRGNGGGEIEARSRRRRTVAEDLVTFSATSLAAVPDAVARRTAGPAGGPGGGGLGDILGDILGGGAGRGGAGRGPAGGLAAAGLAIFSATFLAAGAAECPARASPASKAIRSGGGLGGLGGLLAGGAGGGVLADILSQFEQAGKGDAAKSWVSRGENIPVTPKDIESTFGSGIIDELASQFGLPRDELLKGLSEAMPEAVDALTPDGRLPTAEEITRRV